MAGSRIKRELALEVTGKDVSATRTLRGVNREVSKLGAIAGKAGSNVARNLEHGVALGATAAVGAIGYAIKAATDWDTAMAGVAKTVDGDVSKIAAGIREMSKTVPLGAVELAGLAESAGALGIAKDDILAFTEVSATLGVTTNVSADMAATALGQLGNVLNLRSQDYERFGSTLVDLGNKGASTEAQILEITRRAGGAAHLLHISAAETLGWSSALANLGMNEELAGTALQTFLLKALSKVGSGGDDLKTLAKTAGMTAAQFKKAFGKDASGALQKFIEGLSKLDEGSRLEVVQGIFGKTSGLNRAILGLADSYSRNLAPSIDTANTAWDQNTAMAAEAEKRYKTTASQIQLLQNNIHDAAITIGTELLPEVNALAKEGVDWLGTHQPEVKQFAKDLAAGIHDAVMWAKSLDWDAIADALKFGASAAKTMVDVFAGMPPWAQQLLIGGFVANKFTGGAVQDLVGELGKGLIKGVLGMNAGVVNVKAGVVNGAGGGVAAGAAAGATSKAGKVLNAIGKVFIVGAAVGVFSELTTVLDAQTAQNAQIAAGLQANTAAFTKTASLEDMKRALAGIENEVTQGIRNDALYAAAYNLNINGVRDSVESTKASLRAAINQVESAQQLTRHSAEVNGQQVTAAELSTRDSIESAAIRQIGGLNAVKAATDAARTGISAAAASAGLVARGGGLIAAAAIAAKDLSVTFAPTINTTVSVRETINTRTTYKKYQTTAS